MPKFSERVFIPSSEARMNEREGRMREEGEDEEEGEGEGKPGRGKGYKDPRLGGPSRQATPGLSHRHRMEDRVPLGCLDIGPKVFIEPRSRAAVLTLYLQCFSHFEVVGQAFLVFIGHSSKYLRIFPINFLLTQLFVLGNT